MGRHGGKVLRNALDSHWRKFRKCLKTCREDVSEDNVHELRISTRRLLAVIELLRSLHPLPIFGKLRKILKHQLDGLDELRDTQVMLLEIANTLPILPDLMPFLQFLEQRERALLQQSGPHIASLKQGNLRRKIQKAGRRLKSHSARTDTTASALRAIDGVYAVILERYRAVDANDLASIHHLRIPVKKLRYMLGAVPDLIPDLPDNHQKRLQRYLTRMGDIQNSAVLLKALEAFFVDGVPKEIDAYYRKQQRDLIETFMAHREEILGFWRSSSAEAQPWTPPRT